MLGDHTDQQFFAGHVGTGKLDTVDGVDLVHISGDRRGQREVRAKLGDRALRHVAGHLAGRVVIGARGNLPWSVCAQDNALRG